MHNLEFIFLLIFINPFLGVCQTTDELRLKYNNPDLTTDLGVGLWAWPLPMDFDKDGDFDLVVSCPDIPFNGTYFFENATNTSSAKTVFKSPVKIGAGMKNVQVFVDVDHQRVLGRGVEFLGFRENIFSHPTALFDIEILEGKHEKIRFSQWKYVDYEDDGDLDLIVGIDEWGDYGWDNAYNEKGAWVNGPLHGYVYLLENFEGKYIDRGRIAAGGEVIDVYGAPSPNMNDFDGDGDLDLICGEFLDRLTYFENTGTRENPVFAKGRFLTNDSGIIKMDLEMIIPSAIDWDKDGDIDLVVGDEDGRVALIENTGKINDGTPVFKNPSYFQQEAQDVKFGALATPFSVDWDDDGDEDIISGNSAGYIGFIENLSGGDAPTWAAPIRLKANGDEIRYLAGDSGSIQGPAEKKWGYTTLSVDDWDGDGLKDILVNSIWGLVEWHKNVGSHGAPALLPAKPVVVDWGTAQPPKPAWNWWNPRDSELSTQWRTTPFMIDWNKDGLMDLVMLDPEGYLAFFERFMDKDVLKLKPGQRIFIEVNGKTTASLRLTDRVNGSSGRRKWTFVDWDQDGDLDLVANTKPSVEWYKNVSDHSDMVKFEYQGNLTELKLAGHTTSPTTVEWNQDGKPDLLLGAEDGHFYYIENTY